MPTYLCTNWNRKCYPLLHLPRNIITDTLGIYFLSGWSHGEELLNSFFLHYNLHFNSFPHIVLSILLFTDNDLRLKCICSDPLDYEHQVSILTGYFLNVVYSLHITRQGISRTDKFNCEVSICDYFTTPSTNPIEHFQSIINKQDFASVKDDQSVRESFNLWYPSC